MNTPFLDKLLGITEEDKVRYQVKIEAEVAEACKKLWEGEIPVFTSDHTFKATVLASLYQLIQDSKKNVNDKQE